MGVPEVKSGLNYRGAAHVEGISERTNWQNAKDENIYLSQYLSALRTHAAATKRMRRRRPFDVIDGDRNEWIH